MFVQRWLRKQIQVSETSVRESAKGSQAVYFPGPF